MELGFFIPEGLMVGVAMGALTLALLAALVVSRRRTGLVLTPVTFFFIFAYGHVLFGRYAAAALAAKYSFVGPATLEPFLDQAFLIISLGLTCCLVGYLAFPGASGGRVVRALARLSSEEVESKVQTRSRILVFAAIPLILIGLQGLGGVPLLGDNPRQDRYLLNFTEEHRLDNFLMNRGREIIVFPAALLAMGWYARKRRLPDALIVILAAGGSLLTATRSPILIGALIVLTVLVWRRRLHVVLFTVAAVLAGLVASEIELGTDSNLGVVGWSPVERLGADVAEVRDLAWTLVKHEDNYWGATFVAGFLPVPAFASDFAQTYHLRTITLNALGLPLTAAHGGLRITLSGEWFLNFSWPGVVVGGLLYGWMCSWFSAGFHRLRRVQRLYPIGAFILACAWVMLSFTLYMTGSGSGGTLKTYSFVLFLFLFRLKTAPAADAGQRAGLPSVVASAAR